jgi:hypothetical protein
LRVRFRVLSTFASAVRPRLRRGKPELTRVPFASANSPSAYRTGQCARPGVFGVPPSRRVYMRFPICYGDSTTEGEIVLGPGLRAAAENRFATQAIRSSGTMVRRDDAPVGRDSWDRTALLSCEGGRPEGSPFNPLLLRDSAFFAVSSRNPIINVAVAKRGSGVLFRGHRISGKLFRVAFAGGVHGAPSGAFICFPILFMAKSTTTEKEYMQAPMQMLMSGRIGDEEPLTVIRNSRMRVGVFTMTERQEESGDPVRFVQIEFLNDDQWVPVLGLDERNYPTMMSVFDQVRDFLMAG